MARQHKIGQFVPIYQGGLLAQALRIANEEHSKTYSCMRYNEHTHAQTDQFVPTCEGGEPAQAVKKG